MSKFYLGTTFSRYREARAAIDQITALGHECVEDWTRCDAFDADGELLPSQGDGYVMNESWLPAAEREISAIAKVSCDKDGFCVFLGEQASLGWPVEFGISIAFEVDHIIVVAPFKTTVFMALPNVFEVETIEEALARLADLDEDG